MTNMQEQLFEFVKRSHGSQVRKYTGEPYVNHVLAVAEMCKAFSIAPISYEVALCHDLFEDTEIKEHALYTELRTIGYSIADAVTICECVTELTDIYTKEGFPQFNRRERKLLEVKRMASISILSQSVKYADLMDNTISIVEHDPDFSKVYLDEKLQIIDHMRGGDIRLFVKCCHVLHEAVEKKGYGIFN